MPKLNDSEVKHVSKTVSLKLESGIPLKVYDAGGQLIGAAYLEGFVGLTIVVEKNNPAAFNLDTENGLAKLKLTAHIEDNVVDGSLTVA